MDSEEGPSGAKRMKKANQNELEHIDLCETNKESDIEKEGDTDYSDYEESSEFDYCIDISLQAPNVEVSPNRPASSGSTSIWTTTGDLKNLKFTQINAFYGHPSGNTPIDYFNYFFDDVFLDMICTDTNKQAERLFLSYKTKESSRITEWKVLTVDELKIFFGLLFHMGTISLGRLQDYWKTDRLFSIPIFAEQMSRNRFLLIMKCLYFASESEGQDSLYVIRKVIDYFNEKMENCYYPAGELALDEGITLFRGRLYSHQCKIHNGIKLYMLTEPDGTILKFRVEVGSRDPEGTSEGHAEEVVMQLLQEKLNNGHAVYMDKYYNSFELAKKLLTENTYCTGILRSDLKEIPTEVIQTRLKRGENVSRFCDGVHIGKWRSKREFTYITTQYCERMVPANGGLTQKPEALVRYNDFKPGLDQHEQFLAFYPCEKKTIRWYLKVAIHVFHMLFINSYKFYNKFSDQPKLKLYDYRLCVINSLLPEKVAVVPRPSKSLLVEKRHQLSRITERNSMNRIRRKYCRQCYVKKIRKDSIWQCVTCEDKPGLCVECFDDYHTQAGRGVQV